MAPSRTVRAPTFVGINGRLPYTPIVVRRRRPCHCTFGNGRPRGPNFQPGARGLFWNASGANSPGTQGSPGPDGGPCNLFNIFGGLESAGGMGGAGPDGGDLSNPNSFSFFSASVEYGQRRLCAENHELGTDFPGAPDVDSPRRTSPLRVSSFAPPLEGAGGIHHLHHEAAPFRSVGFDSIRNPPSTLSDLVHSIPSLSLQCNGGAIHGSGSTSGPSPAFASSSNSPPITPAPAPMGDQDRISQQRQSPPRPAEGVEAGLESAPSAEANAPLRQSSREPNSASRQRGGSDTGHSAASFGMESSSTEVPVADPPQSDEVVAPASSRPSPRRQTNQRQNPRQQRPRQGQMQGRQRHASSGGQPRTDGSSAPGGSSGGDDSTARQPQQVSGKVRRQVRSLFERAKEEERAGSIEETRRLLRQCLVLDRRDAHSWLALARLEARCGGVSLKPNSSPSSPASPLTGATVNAGGRLGGESDSSQVSKQNSGAELARRLFEEGVKECPTSVHLLQAWAVLEHRCGDREAARKLFARGLKLEPDNPYVCQAWGLLEQRGGNTEAARDLFSRSVNLRPHPEVCAAWAVLEAREGNVKRARELFQCGLQACKSAESPSAAAIYRSWAEIEERVGDLSGARELLSKAISSQPRVAEAYVALSRLEARRGYSTRALELMQTAAGLSKKPPAVVFNAWAQIEWTLCGRVEAAREILERGHNLHPNDPALLQTLGTLEERSGNVAKAKELYAASIRVRPTAPAFVAWALVEEREGDLVEAVNLFEQALMTDALHGAAYNAYGMMEARRGELDRARAVYERGLKVFASASVYHGYGQLELKLGRNPDRARELFQCGVAQTREDTAFIWHSWGMLELGLRNATAARRVFLDALTRYPRNSRVLVGAALAHSTSFPGVMADEATARDFFKRAVAADPTHAHAWQAWGVFELRRGRKDAAEALFRRGLRMCPMHGALWQAWGVLETSNGDFERARQLFKRGAAACPSHVHLYQAWACMEVRAGNIDRARELLDHALESDPCHGPVWAAYGLLEARHGTLAKARQHFVTGIARAPNHAPLYRTYGQAEVRAGNYDRARKLFREGLSRDPRHAPLYHAFAEFEAMVGNIGAIQDLNSEAQKYFGSEADASAAIRSGEEVLTADVGAASDDGIEYSSKSTPMELALDNM